MTGVRSLWAAALIPAIGIAVLVARAELKLRSGQRFRVAIEGYDPRDLLHGHFLQYRYAFNWQGADTCGAAAASSGAHGVDFGCCVCLTRNDQSGASSAGPPKETPSARQVQCPDAPSSSCDAWLQYSEVAPPRQYFIPEDKAKALDMAFRTLPAEVDLEVRQSGEASVGELYLDGAPWRERVR